MNGATTSPRTGSPRPGAPGNRPSSKLTPGKPEGGPLPDGVQCTEAEANGPRVAEYDRHLWHVEMPSWLASMVLHMALIIGLSLWTFGADARQVLTLLTGSFEKLGEPEMDPGLESIAKTTALSDAEESGLDNIGEDAVDVPIVGVAEHAPGADRVSIGLPGVPNGVLADAAAMQSAGGLEGRIGGRREDLVQGEGGTVESESAVRRGLEWLRLHQRPDGGWRFNLQGSCDGQCRHAGSASSTTAATGLALMAFLGAGQTHQEGEYTDSMRRGVYYLLDRLQPTPHGADLQEGTMYGQGIASIALCEAYAISHDEALRPWAQAAVDFILSAQDPEGGGWRYVPNEPGDVSMHGWQLMAIRSGDMAYLDVPRKSFTLASHFLDTVESQRPFGYGYTTPEDGTEATHAIGTLCRMYEGWPRTDHRLYLCVRRICEIGPSADDMYYNYYATQVVHHWGGSEWQAWNLKMRDYLIRTQGRDGHESGSWQFNGNQGKVGGRLYNTAMAVMTLEVYYRHLPLYRIPTLRQP